MQTHITHVRTRQHRSGHLRERIPRGPRRGLGCQRTWATRLRTAARGRSTGITAAPTSGGQNPI